MQQQKIQLASDNFAPAHPLVIEAIAEANHDFAPAYGLDKWTERAISLIQAAFNSSCRTLIVPSGTGANVLALNIACRRHESVICTNTAHLLYQESGAAEAIVGCKLVAIPHVEGKATPENVRRALKRERAFGRHSTAPRLLSITQATEVGTVYTLEQLRALSKLCKEEGLLLHIDGSRLYQAAVHLDTSLAAIVEAANPDLLSLGGTKNGLLFAEALLIFNPSLVAGSDHLQKQNLQLVSKMRYLSAQFIPFFENGLWRELASHARACASEIAAVIESVPELALSYPVETNQIFFTAPHTWIPRIQEGFACYPWDLEKGEVRFITSWNTSEETVLATRAVFGRIAGS